MDRVDGNLAVARAIGDFKYKDNKGLALKDQAVSPEPDVKVVKRAPTDEFIVNACDGIWDCITSQSCGDKLSLKLKAD